MKKVSYAAIDIGSNAVRLLIKSVNEKGSPEGLMSKVQLIRVPLRLGKDAFTIGYISEEKINKLIYLMEAYRQIMKIYEVADYRACGTSAMRDAANGEEIVQIVKKKTGIHIDIIDGQEEARIVYDNHIEQFFEPDRNYLYVDVGGGSTEINLISEGESKNSHSYNIGTIRMLSGKVKDKEKLFMQNDLEALAKKYAPIHVIGSGGNINKLFRLAGKKNKKESFLPLASLQDTYDILKNLSEKERCKQYKLKPDRADVIIPAAEIFLEIVKRTQADGIIVPTIGLSDGIIDSLYTKNKLPGGYSHFPIYFIRISASE